VLVDAGALRQNLLADRWYSHYLAKEIDHLLGPRQPRQIAMDDKAVKTAIHKQQQASKKACEKLHRSPPCLVDKQDHRRTDRWSQNFKSLWLGFLGRVVHGSSARTWLRELKCKIGERVDYAATEND